ncbi:transketolase [Bacteroidia bacterium]|nr:transketolase [Bacteroidia bacterium]
MKIINPSLSADADYVYMKSIEELQAIAMQVRRDIIRMTSDAKSGHPGGSLGCADFMTTLFFNVMNIEPDKFQMSGRGEDMFFLSNGHISPVLYAVMARRGYFPVNELATFRKIGTRLQGHPSPMLSGIRAASGSLGQGLSVAIGAALGKKLDNDANLVYVLCGDGELQEGQNWEALMYAAAKKVDNLIAVIDYNNLQIDGTCDEVCSLGNLQDKLTAFGWTTLHVPGHDVSEVQRALYYAKTLCGQKKPVIILLKTEMGHGVDFMAGDNKWHGSVTNAEQTQQALAQLTETLGDYQ